MIACKSANVLSQAKSLYSAALVAAQKLKPSSIALICLRNIKRFFKEPTELKNSRPVFFANPIFSLIEAGRKMAKFNKLDFK
jgi:hypothetical protein